MKKLEDCPFCESSNAYIAQNYLGQYYCVCPDCGASVWGKDADNIVTEKQAIELWNRRAAK